MTDNKEQDTEIHPLKSEEGVSPASLTKKGVCLGSSGLSHLSSWRTAAFFLSVFLCLISIFAFSFIIPCPVRPVSQRTWINTYGDSSTYTFLAVTDANNDKVMDVIFAFRGSKGCLNVSCSDAGFSSPCSFLVAVTGTNGSVLWERPLSQELLWVQCGIEKLGGLEAPGCLLFHSQNLTAIDSRSGVTLWQNNNTLGLKQPALKVPDLDGDEVGDVVLIGAAGDETKVVIVSGRTGQQIGIDADPGLSDVLGHVIHVTSSGSYYILFKKADSAVYGYALKNIVAMAIKTPGSNIKLQQDPKWEEMTNSTSGSVPVYNSGSVQHLLKMGNQGKTPENLLLVTGHWVELTDGQSLRSLWRVNITKVISEPVFGNFNKDGVPDVVIEDEIGNGTKKVVILDGSSGAVLWEVDMVSSSTSPKTSTVNTTDYRSAFLFWGEIPGEANATVSLNQQHFLYLLHPSYPKILLELNNSTESIAAFKAVLFEKSRHAGYMLLTGPTEQSETGSVSLAKRKLKEDVAHSRVVRLSQEEGFSDQEIRDSFFRLRYSSST
ncbi:Protein ITFG3 [Acipenser ruthenus]|uniref:Protein ITFG3 n=1 Tax=Acipenser ruthenus TaxID=7906 RepID=A0A662Z2Q7_ACIRT|nr:protein FAM234A isoform X1 [Acipenser ruthenus]XP_034782476.1 protein FAM234A isoform X1 [Acipenser ruthenus]XP_034782477.1 protein FAM234A isoform X1 [Acipenser ruthenus]XP_058851868.1 protein FAM234A isoform X1 [Acipenser ruthenus]RXN02019.1 Protein ITFG3 [Acipenser ruthenus]